MPDHSGGATLAFGLKPGPTFDIQLSAVPARGPAVFNRLSRT